MNWDCPQPWHLLVQVHERVRSLKWIIAFAPWSHQKELVQFKFISSFEKRTKEEKKEHEGVLRLLLPGYTTSMWTGDCAVGHRQGLSTWKMASFKSPLRS